MVAQVAKSLGLGLLSVSIPLTVTVRYRILNLAILHFFSFTFLLFQGVGIFFGENHTQIWYLIRWGTQFCLGLFLLFIASFYVENIEAKHLQSFALSSNANWSTLHAISIQSLVQIAYLPQLTPMFSKLLYESGIKSDIYPIVQYSLAFLTAFAAIFAVDSLRHKDVLVFTMTVATMAYFGLGILFLLLRQQNKANIILVALALHSLLSCIYPVLLLISWIYTIGFFAPESRVAGFSIAVASRWLVDACVSASIPQILESHKAFFFLTLGAICFCSAAILTTFPEKRMISIAKKNEEKSDQVFDHSEDSLKNRSPGSSTL